MQEKERRKRCKLQAKGMGGGSKSGTELKMVCGKCGAKGHMRTNKVGQPDLSNHDGLWPLLVRLATRCSPWVALPIYPTDLSHVRQVQRQRLKRLPGSKGTASKPQDQDRCESIGGR